MIFLEAAIRVVLLFYAEFFLSHISFVSLFVPPALWQFQYIILYFCKYVLLASPHETNIKNVQKINYRHIGNVGNASFSFRTSIRRPRYRRLPILI